MAIQIAGASGTAAEVGGTLYRALRVEQRPLDYGSLGSYRFAHLSGTMAAGLAAAANIFSARWGDATRFAVMHKIVWDGLSGSATAFTAGFASVRAFFARSFTASDSAGTALTLTGNNGKTRSNQGSTLFTDIRGSATAALTAGTRTLDTQAFGQISRTIGTGVSVEYTGQVPMYGEDIGPTPPLVFAQNEGFVIQATVPATGTWQFGVTMVHTEVAAY